MKIALVTIYFDKNVGIGGLAYEIAKRLSQNRYLEIHVFCTNIPEPENTRIIYHKVPIIDKSNILKMVSFSVSSALMLYINRLLGLEFDIIHSLNRTLYKADIVSCFGCERAGIEKFNMLKNNGINIYSASFMAKYEMVLPLLEYNFKRDHCSAVIVSSGKVKKELIHYFQIQPERISLIREGVDIMRFNPINKVLQRRDIRHKHGITENQFVFLFVGSPFLAKGLLWLIRAFSLIGDESCILLCAGEDPKGYHLITESIKDASIRNRIIFSGLVKNIEQYYGAADVLVHPSYYDAFPLVVIEAMSSGLPVIVSRECGVVDIIENGINGLIWEDIMDEVELADKMRALLRDPPYRERLGRNARKTAERYSWNNISSDLMKKYEEKLAPFQSQLNQLR